MHKSRTPGRTIKKLRQLFVDAAHAAGSRWDMLRAGVRDKTDGALALKQRVSNLLQKVAGKLRDRPILAVALASATVVASVVSAVTIDRIADRASPQALAVAGAHARAGAADPAGRSARATPGAKPSPAARPTKPAPKRVAAKPNPAKTARKPATTRPKPAPPRPKPKWVSPMPGVRLSSCYGWRWGRMHQGIDLAGASGTPIRAVGAGRVAAAGWNYTGYGISVVVDHGHGYLTHYAHASRVLVRVGQRVTPGQRLAIEGSTGNSTGPHLHFEVHRSMWHQIDPARWLRARGVKIGC